MAILLLYMIKPGLLKMSDFASHLLLVWKKSELRGDAYCRRITAWVATFLSLYYCEKFREL